MFRTTLILLTLLAPATSAEYTVATTGSDANPGTSAHPFATIGRAVQLLAAGDTVIVRGGTYRPTATIGIWASGTAAQPIVVRAAAGETPIIDGSDITGTYPNVFSNGGDRVTIQGLDVRNSRGIGIQNWKASHTAYLDNRISDSQGSGIAIESDDLTSSNDILVQGNVVTRSCLSNRARTADGGWGMGINLGRANRVTVRGNRSTENWGEGIGCYLSDSCTVVGNVVVDAYSVSIYLDNATNCIIDGNFAYSTGNVEYLRLGKPATGFQIANEDYGSQSNPSRDNVVRNNIFSSLRAALYYGSYGKGGGLQGLTFANNTCYQMTEMMVAIDAGNHNGTRITGNVFQQTSGVAQVRLGGSLVGITRDHNAWSGGSAGALISGDDVTAAPALVNAGSLTADDYRPAPGSPLIDGAESLTTVPLDRAGTARPQGQAPDIGAFEVIPDAPLRINFQPATAPTIAGWMMDSGLPFASRGGQEYGWNATNDTARDRNAATSADQRYDTLIHLQKAAKTKAVWEITVPNGLYEVTLLAGDALFYDSRYAITAEGTLIMDATPTSAQRWVSATGSVTVRDGRLTVTTPSQARNAKLNSIEIIRRPTAAN